MRRSWLGLALVLSLVGCLPKSAAPPVVMPASALVSVTVTAAGAPVAGATVRIDGWGVVQTDGAGVARAQVPAALTASHLWVTADGYLEYSEHLDIRGPVLLAVELRRAIPVPPGLDAPYRGNICGMRDSDGDVIFDGDIPGVPQSKRLDWYARKRAAGLYDVVLAAKGGYDPRWKFDYTRNPAKLLELWREATAQGFRVTWFLSSGDSHTAGDIDDYFGTLIDALAETHLKAFWTPAWEPVPGGWTSADLNHALQVMTAHLPAGAVIAVHLGDTRPTFNSNPVEPDDPWRVWSWGVLDDKGELRVQGTCDNDRCRSEHPVGRWDGREPDAWSLRSGYNGVPTFGWRVGMLLYQTESGGPLLRARDYPDRTYPEHPGYLARLYEISIRTLTGGRGWRPARVVLFESIAWDYYNGYATEADGARIAAEVAALGFTEFGNGLPTITAASR